MKDHSTLENEAESARTNCPSCTNPARYLGSELSSLFIFSATCFLGFKITVGPAALVSTFLLPQSLALGLSWGVLSAPGGSSAEGLWLLDGERREHLGWQLPWWEIKRLLMPFFYVCAVF